METKLTIALRLTLPAMLLRLWGRDVAAWDAAESNLLHGDGILRVRDDLLAVLPVAGDACVGEAALFAARRFFASRPPEVPAAALAFPGEITLTSNQSALIPNPLLDDLDQEPPVLDDRIVYFTSHAAHELESRWALVTGGEYRGPSGRVTPLLRLGEARGDLAPWRNPELLTLRPGTYPRPEVVEAVRRSSRYPAVLVTGPMGCGKTRTAWEVFRDEGRPVVWTSTWSVRSGGPGIAKQVLRPLTSSKGSDETPLQEEQRRVLASWWRQEDAVTEEALGDVLLELVETRPGPQPVAILCDDLERSSRADRALVTRLLDSPALGSTFQLVLVARSGTDLPSRWQKLPHVEVPAWDGDEMKGMANELLAGLSMPAADEARFVGVCKGSPLALEEGLLQLARRKILRHLYGNFFFAGRGETVYQPSFRLIRHVEAECRRLGYSTAPRILALAQTPIPESELAATGSSLGEPIPASWSQPFLRAGFLRQAPSPWGPGVEFACEAFARSLSSTVAGPSADSPRHALGHLLAGLKSDGPSSWHAYRLLSGSPEAVHPLLVTALRPGSGVSREQLLDALVHELENHRERKGDAQTEMKILWALLPLARRMGRLRHLAPALDRALELARDDASKFLALTALKAENELNDGQSRAAEKSLLKGLELARDTNDRRQALLCIQLGKLFQHQARYDEARRLFEDLLPALESAGSASLAATCRFHLGNVALHEHRLQDALEYHEKALATRREQGLLRHLGASLSALGNVKLARGEYQRGLLSFREAQAVLEDHGREGEVSFALLGVGRALSRLGDYTSATPLLRRALALRKDRDDMIGEALARLEVAENLLYLGQSDTALEEARECHFHLSMAEAGRDLGAAEQLLGRICLHHQHPGPAAEHFRNAMTHHQEHGDTLRLHLGRAWLLEALIAQDEAGEIETLCAKLQEVAATHHYPEVAETLDLRLYLGLRWLQEHGRPVEPLEPLRRAYDELNRKTALLSPHYRHGFLHLIPDHRALLHAATEHGLAPPSEAVTVGH